MAKQGLQIHITGVVQGVGFRPFVYSLARRFNLTGWVKNTSAGVDILVDGSADDLDAFSQALRFEAPPLARIDQFDSSTRSANGFKEFTIIDSEAIADAFVPISPDVSICPDCLREMNDQADRRYRYPFTNCTNCGPRFTIIQDIPYDRPFTTMAPFTMCPDCAAEYQDPLDRRFHAQPVACPVCGPHVWLEKSQSQSKNPGAEFSRDQAIQETRTLLRLGLIIAIKGLGGFHLACDATNADAVGELRRRKLRVDKPFAVMMPDSKTVLRHCYTSEVEIALLESRERPIVILERRPESTIAEAVAPAQTTVGVMLPYTPLHHLLLEPAAGYPEVLVMTSGNLAEEPIVTTNAEARQRLVDLADAFLLHNRAIHTRCDDSVIRANYPPPVLVSRDSLAEPNRPSYPANAIYFLRRSRGYAPFPILMPGDMPPLLATGAELKNTFCLTNGRYAFLSHHIGDLENYETLEAFTHGIDHFEKLFRVAPEAVAYDLHPNYLATRYALERARNENLPAIGVQHHHAHIVSCMAEHQMAPDRPVIGLAFDGTGYGDDGAIWGGEVLLADYAGYRRLFHLGYVPLPGGDKAIREPWRIALAWLRAANIEWTDQLPSVRHAIGLDYGRVDVLTALSNQLESGLNSPPTSSIGRLFDAVAAIIGLRQTVNYEAQAAIELEAIVDPDETNPYPVELTESTIDATPLIGAVVRDYRQGLDPGLIAARFHRGIAHIALECCRRIRQTHDLNEVFLSGGVWQNMTLLNQTQALLTRDGFSPYIHHQVPANDGGLSLGQAIVAVHTLGTTNR